MIGAPIQVLSASLVNRIAAGEVIERPASVVKELVENALDAGAKSIAVEIEDGGRQLVRVIDDGCGIPPEQLPLAFAEHATSKLADDDDLFRITTMGFRGEALASIGSVSQSRVLSRTEQSPAAYEIFNRGGQISQPQAAAGNRGTTVEVRNLFFNTPARRKFLRGAATEFGHISDVLLRLALPHPQVAMTLSHNGRMVLDLPAATAQERLLAAWPADFAERRMAIDLADAEMRIGGLAGPPELAQATAKHQFLYVNGRHVRDRFIQHAVKEAYRGLIEPGRQPAVILMVHIPPQDLDVNVHPTKIEVRFRDSGRIHGLVLAAIRQRLLDSDLTPGAVAFSTQEPPGRMEMREKLAAFFQQLPPEVAGSRESQGLVPMRPSDELRGQEQREAAKPLPRAEAIVGNPPTAIQVHNSYLVAQTDDGMIIIDQHALHERIVYEELRARLARGPLESQRLLLPAPVPASERQTALLEQIHGLLTRLGIEISPFGPGAVAVHSFPSFLGKLDPGQFVADLLDRGEQELLDLHEEELLHELLDMMACKAAVKAGDALSPAEIEALLVHRDLVERSSNCPHGRPTTLRLTLKDLEKQFKRTGF